jgi:hypothetical protein
MSDNFDFDTDATAQEMTTSVHMLVEHEAGTKSRLQLKPFPYLPRIGERLHIGGIADFGLHPSTVAVVRGISHIIEPDGAGLKRTIQVKLVED